MFATLILKCSRCFWALWSSGNAAPRPSGGSAMWELSLCTEPGWQLKGYHRGKGQNKQQIDRRRRRNSHSEGGQTLGQGPEGLWAPIPGDAPAWLWCLEQPALPGPALSRGGCPRSLLAGIFSVRICVIYPINSVGLPEQRRKF